MGSRRGIGVGAVRPRGDRAEALFDLGGMHPEGFGHPHVYHAVAALTAVLLREILRNRARRIAH
jgi:hypothetical protein